MRIKIHLLKLLKKPSLLNSRVIFNLRSLFANLESATKAQLKSSCPEESIAEQFSLLSLFQRVQKQ